MSRFARFLSGAMVGAAILTGAMALAPHSVSARPVLSCSGNICCTYDDATGKIYDCKTVNPT